MESKVLDKVIRSRDELLYAGIKGSVWEQIENKPALLTYKIEPLE